MIRRMKGDDERPIFQVETVMVHVKMGSTNGKKSHLLFICICHQNFQIMLKICETNVKGLVLN